LAAAKDYADIVPILRPASMATDTAPKLPVIQHCFTEVEKTTGMRFETAVDIDATSPLRSVDDLIAAVKLLESHPEADNLITAMPARRSPYFNLVEQQADGYVQLSKGMNSSIVRRQDAPPSYDMNASIYVWERSKLLSAEKVVSAKTILYVMPEERSIDIDSALDFRIVEMLLLERIEEFKMVKTI
jgi:N-acylneuraminate cytidylyltransferase/CMP-N,N'-diacetyllegionaminic acid synthase